MTPDFPGRRSRQPRLRWRRDQHIYSTLLLLLLSLASRLSVAVATTSYPLMRAVDEDIYHAQIPLFHDEWENLIQRKTDTGTAPVLLWFRCIQRQIRGYYFIEHLLRLDHGKEAYMPVTWTAEQKLKLFADNVPVKTRHWLGGVDFTFAVNEAKSVSDWIDIRFEGVKHYTRVPLSICTPPPEPTPVTKPGDVGPFIMHVHLNDHYNLSHINKLVVQGVAQHMLYHKCALQLANYEVVVHQGQVARFLEHPVIAHAAAQGWITFIIRNPTFPPPISMRNTHDKHEINCYWQAYTENLALLRHWQRHERIYFFDSDEFLSFSDSLTRKQYFALLQAKKAIGFQRFMTFCASCFHSPTHHRQHDVNQFTFSTSELWQVPDKLQHPKLVVDPNAVGCYIVHWAGCGEPTVEVNNTQIARILHFENFYFRRWQLANVKGMNGRSWNKTTVTQVCDPVKLAKQLDSVPYYFDVMKQE